MYFLYVEKNKDCNFFFLVLFVCYEFILRTAQIFFVRNSVFRIRYFLLLFSFVLFFLERKWCDPIYWIKTWSRNVEDVSRIAFFVATYTGVILWCMYCVQSNMCMDKFVKYKFRILVAQDFSESIHVVNHDPSMALYRIQEHVRRSVPAMVGKRVS